MPTSDPGAEVGDDLGSTGGIEEERPVIVRIEFEGNALFASESLKVFMELKEGERLDPVALDEDMETLFRFFDKVRVTKDPVPGGVVLRFFVAENPLVVELRVYGIEEFGETEIREMMSTRVGYPLFPYALATDAEDIVEAYRMRGFHFAQVPKPIITALANGGRTVSITVVEGPKVEVQSILFRGNAHVARKDLLEVMQTKEEGFIPFFTDAAFRMDTLLEDLVAIKRRVEAAGFLDAEVVLDGLRFSDDKERALITIAIEEHQPYRVGNIDVEIVRLEPDEIGAPPPCDIEYFTEDRIRCLLGLESGGCYSGIQEEKGRECILEQYYRRSYIEADLLPTVRRGRERENIVDLELKIIEGQKALLRRIDFVGNEYTRDRVLRREARTTPGCFIDRRELDRTLTRIQGSGYFERVTMVIEDAETRDGEAIEGWKDVRYEIVEGSTGQLNFGVGISTDGGVAGSVSFSKRNFDITRFPRSLTNWKGAFTGAGQKFDIFLSLGTITSQFSVGFVEPHVFGTDLSFGVNIYRRAEFWESYDVDRLGYNLTLRYPLYRHVEDKVRLLAGVGWRQGLADVNDIGTFAVPGVYLFEGENEIRGLEGRLSLDTVDDLADPTIITQTVLQAEAVGTFLGGSVNMYKLSALHEDTWAVYRDSENRKHRLTFRARVGFSEALEDTPEVPPFERFFMGGQTLRGFAYREAGPHINDRPTGGEWLVNYQLEYQYPLIDETVGLVGFIDGGTLGTSIWADDAWDWRLSTGVGIRLKIPMLGPRPLALDFGWPLIKYNGDKESLVTFSIGRDF